MIDTIDVVDRIDGIDRINGVNMVDGIDMFNGIDTNIPSTHEEHNFLAFLQYIWYNKRSVFQAGAQTINIEKH